MVKQDKKINPLKINHPNSRKAKQFARQVNKVHKQEKRAAKYYNHLNEKKNLLTWFRDNIDSNITECSVSMFIELINKYMNRYNDELLKIEGARLPGVRKKHASREDFIRNVISNESRDFDTCGLEVPNLLDKEYVKRLRSWDGDICTLEHFPLYRYAKSKLETMNKK